MTDKTTKSKADDDTPVLEWIAGALGALLFLAALAVLVSEGMSPKTPPAVIARVIGVEAQANGWLMLIEAQNEGDDPAEDVRLLVSAAGETREVTFDFIGPHSARRAGVFLAGKPDPAQVSFKALGYLEP